MMRRLSYCLFFLALAACVPEGGLTSEWDGPVIELGLQIEDSGETKADDNGVYDQSGDNVFHENDIKWVDFFFYPAGRSASNATFHQRKQLEQLTRWNATFRIELTANDVNNRIFPSYDGITEATVLALVNVPQALLDEQDETSIDALKALTVTTDFAAYTAQENHRQQSFMMSGEGTLRLKQPDGRSRKEVAEPLIIEVARYACKLTVGVKPLDTVLNPTKQTDEEGNTVYETWTPSLTEMKIYLEDGIKTVSLSGEPRALATDAEKLSYRSNPLLFFEDRGAGTVANPILEQIFDRSPAGYYNTYPAYMYPQVWDDGKPGEPYLKLILPWIRQEDQFKKEFYYKILIPKDRRGENYVNTFRRNNWYHYNIDVGMLGADTDDASVVINPVSCYVYYWQDKNVVVRHADIGNARYFSVADTTSYVINNESELPIRFITSHPFDYVINSATRPYYGQQTSGTVAGGTICLAGHPGNGNDSFADALYEEGTYYLKYDASTWFSKEGNIISLNHPLNADYTSSSFDYSPYTFSLTAYHRDKGPDSEYAETITITQNPAIYITAETNSDPKVSPATWIEGGREEPYDDKQENSTGPVWQNYKHNGYVFIDGKRTWRHKTSKNDDGEYGVNAKRLASRLGVSWTSRNNGVTDRLEWLQWRTVNFTGGNRNLYTITVTSLPANSRYIIGDPRTLVAETWNNGYEEGSTAVANSKYYYWYDSSGDGERDKEEEEYKIEFTQAPDIRTKEIRPLTHYYPAEESSRTENMLAPALRVSSRFGGVEFYDGFTQRSARFKCATYQEDGYPAGRWRLPTKAEIDFIGTLTQQSGFVKLFGTGGKYWSAHGAVQPNAGVKDVTYALVRCVYDAWYWDTYDDRIAPEHRDEYYFGDFER